MIPQTPTHPSKLQQGDLRIPGPQMQRVRPTCPDSNQSTNLNSHAHCPPTWERLSRASPNMNLNLLATSRLFFSCNPKNFRLHLHASKTSCILLPFHLSYTLPRRLIFFTFSCSYPLYNSYQIIVPPYFGVWYLLLLESCWQLLYVCTSRY